MLSPSNEPNAAPAETQIRIPMVTNFDLDGFVRDIKSQSSIIKQALDDKDLENTPVNQMPVAAMLNMGKALLRFRPAADELVCLARTQPFSQSFFIDTTSGTQLSAERYPPQTERAPGPGAIVPSDICPEIPEKLELEFGKDQDRFWVVVEPSTKLQEASQIHVPVGVTSVNRMHYAINLWYSDSNVTLVLSKYEYDRDMDQSVYTRDELSIGRIKPFALFARPRPAAKEWLDSGNTDGQYNADLSDCFWV